MLLLFGGLVCPFRVLLGSTPAFRNRGVRA